MKNIILNFLKKLPYLKLIKLMWLGSAVVLLGSIGLIISIQGNWFNLFGTMPNLNDLENPDTNLASELWSADGVLLGKYYRENRISTTYDDLSPKLIDALLATEDIRFYEHSGIDLKGLMAIPYYLLQGKKRGSSTISQQLARNLFKSRGETYDGYLSRFPPLRLIITKLKDWILTLKIERSYTKQEIITLYFNTVDFGSNSFGIKVAAKTFFKTTPAKLDILQAAILVGLLKGPSYYSPIHQPARALKRRNIVLAQLKNYNYISSKTLDSLRETPLSLAYTQTENHQRGLATYFRQEVAKKIRIWCRKRGIDLYSDGIKIYTTLDSRMQTYAEQSVQKHIQKQQALFFDHWKGQKPWVARDTASTALKYIEIENFLQRAFRRTKHYKNLAKLHNNDSVKIWKELTTPKKMRVFAWDSPTFEKDTLLSSLDSMGYYKHFLHAGMMSMETQTGQIKAWVGGINYKHFQYDHVRQGRRQPGSTFKPIIYAAAIEEKGFHPCFQVLDAPVSIEYNNRIWTPKNSGRYTGQMYTLRQAIAESINTVAAYLIAQLTPAKAVYYAKEKFQIQSPLQAVPSLCLGTSDVSLFELVPAYATFANKGVWTKPIFITHIEDQNGNLLERFSPQRIEALSESTAYIMTYMLRGGLEERGGTGLGLKSYNFTAGNQVAGKTGTTSNYSDAWYVGLTKELVTGVWVGATDRSIHFRNLKYGQGSRLAMPAFAYYTEAVYKDEALDYQKGIFEKPEAALTIDLNCENYQKKSSEDDVIRSIDDI